MYCNDIHWKLGLTHLRIDVDVAGKDRISSPRNMASRDGIQSECHLGRGPI